MTCAKSTDKMPKDPKQKYQKHFHRLLEPFSLLRHEASHPQPKMSWQPCKLKELLTIEDFIDSSMIPALPACPYTLLPFQFRTLSCAPPPPPAAALAPAANNTSKQESTETQARTYINHQTTTSALSSTSVSSAHPLSALSIPNRSHCRWPVKACAKHAT